jgi:probable rRNA maturation factor
MDINFSEGWLPSKEIMNYLERAAELVLRNEGIDSQFMEISLTFVEPEEIQDLNRLHRNIDSVTDVLSFPQYENADVIKAEIQDEEKVVAYEDIHITLGDVVICKDKIEEQAEYYGHSFDRELIYLFTHSILHLLGYDHEDDEEQTRMRCVENLILDEVGLGRKRM